MDIREVKQQAVVSGLTTQVENYSGYTHKNVADGDYPRALANAKALVMLLQELLKHRPRPRKPRKPRSDKGTKQESHFPASIMVNVPTPTETSASVEKLGKKHEAKTKKEDPFA